MRCAFGDIVLDTDRFLLLRGGEPVRIEPQVFDVLAHLVSHRDRVVLKTELLDEVWGDRFVSESALTSRIRDARRIVGDDGSRQHVIRTVHGRGFQFVAEVSVLELDERPSPADPPPALEQRIKFATSTGGVRIAYAMVGEGPPLVRAPHWITHLDYDWHSPVWRHWLEGLARGRTLVRFDQRGCGLSDHEPPEITPEAFVHDLEAVVDAAGLERFPLLGVSQGGPVSVLYAARHPERVSKLVLVGSYVRGRLVRATTEEDRRAAQLQTDIIRHGWGSDDPSFRMVFPPSFMPDAPPELWSAFAELLRRTTSADSAVRITTALHGLDVTDAAAQLEVPTLIFHGRGDRRIPFDQAREYAALIKDSRLVPLDTRNHLMLPDEPAWEHFLDELHRFLDDADGLT